MITKVKLLKIICLLFIYSLPIFSQVSTAPYIKVISPNGGEKWEANSTQTISWQSNNITKIKIEYSFGGMVWHSIATNIDASSGQYSWTVLNVQIAEVLIKVSDASNPFVFDINDKQFRIVIGAEKKPQALNKAAGITSTQIKIMPLGDSITQGDGDDTSQVGYRSKLFDLLEATGYNFTFVGSQSSGTSYTNNQLFDWDHEGHPGMEVGLPAYDYPNRPIMLDNIDSYLTSNLPDILLFHMGTNDLNFGGSSTEVATQISLQLKQVIADHILISNPNSITFLAKIIHNNHVSETTLNSEIQTMYDALSPEQKQRIKLVDMHSSPELIYPDDFSAVGSGYGDLHPIRTGYDIMADKWFAALQNYFQPTLALPINDATNQPVGVALNWNAPPAASDISVVYQVQISTDPLFSALILDDQNVSSTSRQTTGLLQYATTYYWRVRIPSFGWSTVWNFTTEPNPVASCPNFMLSYWKLDETSGTTYTDFFSGNDGTAVNAPTPVPTGQVSGAQSFDGVNDQISAPSNIIYDWAFNVSFSFEFWMNHSTSVPSSAEVIVGRKNDVSSNLAIWVGLDGSTGKITFSVRSKKTSIPVEDYFVQGPSLNDGLWHHVVAVRDASTNELRIYVDGVLKNSILTSYTEGFDAPSSQITIGWFDALDNAYRYNGIIDELAIYNSVLSPTQIQNDYIKGLERKDYCDRFLLLASKVFLEGPYDEATSDVMFTNLNTNSLIPIISPYSQDPRTVDPIPADVVDWALVELRSTDVGSAVISKSVFLHKSGNLVADDGINQNIFFAVAPGNYYIVVKHRNHLGIMSAAPPVALSTSSTFYDFTTGSGQYYGGSAGAKLIDTSPSDVWGMIAGDGNGNGGISIDDLNLVWRVENGTIGYKNGDYNLNGGVSIDDRNLYWRLNNGTLSQVP